MKTNKLFLILIIGLVIFSSCKKEQVQPPTVDSSKPKNMNELVANTAFDWKTTKDYQISINGNYNEVVTIKSANGVVFHKGFLKAGNTYKVNISLPAGEKNIHLIYHGADVECKLIQASINYTFNTK